MNLTTHQPTVSENLSRQSSEKALSYHRLPSEFPTEISRPPRPFMRFRCSSLADVGVRPIRAVADIRFAKLRNLKRPLRTDVSEERMAIST